MKTTLLSMVILFLATKAIGGAAVDVIEFQSSKGAVFFNHDSHVKLSSGNCKLCHTGRPGQIMGFNMEQAHQLCVGCHEPQEGSLAGPVTCGGCHQGSPKKADG